MKTSHTEARVSAVNIPCSLLHSTTIPSCFHPSLFTLAAPVIFWLSSGFMFVEEPSFTKVSRYQGQTVSSISGSEVPHFSKSKEICIQITVAITTSLRIKFGITISLWLWDGTESCCWQSGLTDWVGFSILGSCDSIYTLESWISSNKTATGCPVQYMSWV